MVLRRVGTTTALVMAVGFSVHLCSINIAKSLYEAPSVMFTHDLLYKLMILHDALSHCLKINEVKGHCYVHV